ncbi:MAG TPA: DUF4145 domain-containing protein [bacterium]|nr:DUF4145 domain-containing protein [bacterium]
MYPKGRFREACPEEVPAEVAADYNEACKVIDISPTAAAALARRCMQFILVKAGGAPEKKMVKDKSGGQREVDSTLFDQIGFVINNKRAPEWVLEQLQPTRKVGNFAAHAKKDVTGQILRTEPDEAEWTLEVLKTLFDFYYVAPAKAKQRLLAVEKKQQKAEK